MATVLIVDSKGRRRVRIEAAAIKHKTYSAGTLQEAIKQMEIYVPEFLVLPGGPDDPLAREVLTFIREHREAKFAGIRLIVPGATPDCCGVAVISSNFRRPEEIVATIEDLLDAESSQTKAAA